MAAKPKRRVLVVDDHEDSREVLESLLFARGFDVVGVADAEAALESLRETRADAIVTDLTLPGMTGEALAAHVRAQGDLAEVRLIATSGRDVAPELAVLFDDVMKKPLAPAALVAALNKLLDA